MTRAYYFGYGSNMLVERLQARCASARVIGAARAAGYAFSFDKLASDGTGKAMIAPATRSGTEVFGVLYEMDAGELPVLDTFEGVGAPDGYRRIDDFPVVEVATGIARTSVTYLADATPGRAGLAPFDWYLALCVEGARQQKLPADYVARLAMTQALVDPEPGRPRRLLALEALKAAGIAGP